MAGEAVAEQEPGKAGEQDRSCVFYAYPCGGEPPKAGNSEPLPEPVGDNRGERDVDPQISGDQQGGKPPQNPSQLALYGHRVCDPVNEEEIRQGTRE
jgi:hypothetical protein